METSLLIALSKQLAIRRDVDLMANNLANSTTPGFKGEQMVFAEFVMNKGKGTGREMSFVQDMGQARDMGQGPLKNTGNTLDVAIDGDGWFAIDFNGEERYTRNGHFRLDEEGRLVTTGGYPVKNGDGGPIVFEPNDTEIVINGDGTIQVEGEDRGRISMVSFADMSTMSKTSGNLFRSNSEPEASTAVLAQGLVEESNVRPVVELTALVEAMRSYQSAQKMVDEEHRRQRQAIEKLVRES